MPRLFGEIFTLPSARSSPLSTTPSNPDNAAQGKPEEHIPPVTARAIILGSWALKVLLLISIVITVTVIVYCVLREKDERSKRAERMHPPHDAHPTPTPEPGTWRFIVSGDSRNCGDIVVPTIAADSLQRYQPSFYWHLGDLRAIYKVDEDMAFASGESDGKKLACTDYLKQAWPDFVKHQIYPFGRTPFYLGLGNHEVIPPKGHPQGSPESLQPEVNSARFTSYFADWLLPPALKSQRMKDHDCDAPSPSPCTISARNYYHWVQGGVDFYYLDNASHVFGRQQLDWFTERVQSAKKDSSVRTLIVGMHEALPDSISKDHAMCDPDLLNRYKEKYPFKQSCDDGKEAYQILLDFQNEAPEKQVYLLASHSHFFMDGIFKTKNNPPARRLRGWIVGTAGAIRYKLPPDSYLSNYAETDTYGYLVGTVDSAGNVQFYFQHLTEADVPADVRQRYQQDFVNWCFVHNSDHPEVKKETNDQCANTPAEDAPKK